MPTSPLSRCGSASWLRRCAGSRIRPTRRGGDHQAPHAAVLRARGQHRALLGAKDHLNVFIYDPIAPDPTGLINQGQGNATARGIQIRRGDELDEAALVALFRAVIANNRAGGWRKVQAQL